MYIQDDLQSHWLVAVITVTYVHLFSRHFWGAKGAPILFSLLGIRMASCSYMYIFLSLQMVALVSIFTKL